MIDTMMFEEMFSEEDAGKIRQKNIANILRKLNAGKTLTAREEALLGGATPSDSGFAKTQDELAKACGVDRRTILNARKQFARTAPPKRADGRYPIYEYKTWLSQHAVSGRRGDVELESERDIKLQHARLRLDRERFDFEKEKDRMLPSTQFEAALARTLSAFVAALNAFPSRVNELLEGLDFDGRAEALETEVELLRKTLATCDYLADPRSDRDED
ncbi:MAG: hypothetical protein M3O82_01165 [Verrucomicrobiota bacterium]|nr:hypothetical protein [Verrucomicrobiota bacterium]